MPALTEALDSESNSTPRAHKPGCEVDHTYPRSAGGSKIEEELDRNVEVAEQKGMLA